MDLIVKGGIDAQVSIQRSCWSVDIEEISSGVLKVKKLLSLVEVMASVPERLEHAPVLYAIFNAITGSSQLPPILGG
jgi:hypothetical protein